MKNKVFLLLSLYIFGAHAIQYKNKGSRHGGIYAPNPMTGKKSYVDKYEAENDHGYDYGYYEKEKETYTMENENGEEDYKDQYESQEAQYAYTVKEKPYKYQYQHPDQTKKYGQNQNQEMRDYKPNYPVGPVNKYKVPYYQATLK